MAVAEELYEQYSDLVQFYYVYVSEAHALDDERPKELAKAKGIREPRTYTERCSVAKMFHKDKKVKIPIIVDTIKNTVAENYRAHPTRAFVILTNGQIGVSGRGGSRWYQKNVEEVEEWLALYRKTGQEPELTSGD